MGRRWMAARVTGELLDALVKPGPPGHWVRVSSGLPADAEFVRAVEDHATFSWLLVYSHPSFREVPEGSRVPLHDSPRMETRWHFEPPPYSWHPTPDAMSGVVSVAPQRLVNTFEGGFIYPPDDAPHVVQGG